MYDKDVLLHIWSNRDRIQRFSQAKADDWHTYNRCKQGRDL